MKGFKQIYTTKEIPKGVSWWYINENGGCNKADIHRVGNQLGPSWIKNFTYYIRLSDISKLGKLFYDL
jgi:hypothetical protein